MNAPEKVAMLSSPSIVGRFGRWSSLSRLAEPLLGAAPPAELLGPFEPAPLPAANIALDESALAGKSRIVAEVTGWRVIDCPRFTAAGALSAYPGIELAKAAAAPSSAGAGVCARAVAVRPKINTKILANR